MTARKRIFIVDDEQVIARTLCLIFQHHGYDAQMFFSAESALSALEEDGPPDVLLCDVILTGMSGLELAETLRERFPSLHVLLMSGQAATSMLIEAARRRGFAPHVLTKPVRPESLVSKVAEIVAA